MARVADEIRWERLGTAIGTMERTTREVLGVIPDDVGRKARLLALSDVRAVMNHITAEEGKHS